MPTKKEALKQRLSVLETGIAQVMERVAGIKARMKDTRGRIVRDRDARKMQAIRTKLGI